MSSKPKGTPEETAKETTIDPENPSETCLAQPNPPTDSGPLTAEERPRLLAHFKEIQHFQKAAGHDQRGPSLRNP